MEREDPLYQGMTRDAMVLGVTLDCFVLEAIVWSVAFLITRSLWVLPAAALFHLLCYWKCLDDADFFGVWWVRFAHPGRQRREGQGAAPAAVHPVPRALRRRNPAH
jgi:type IV secretory pathway VirB3-like protein